MLGAVVVHDIRALAVVRQMRRGDARLKPTHRRDVAPPLVEVLNAEEHADVEVVLGHVIDRVRHQPRFVSALAILLVRPDATDAAHRHGRRPHAHVVVEQPQATDVLLVR